MAGLFVVGACQAEVPQSPEKVGSPGVGFQYVECSGANPFESPISVGTELSGRAVTGDGDALDMTSRITRVEGDLIQTVTELRSITGDEASSGTRTLSTYRNMFAVDAGDRTFQYDEDPIAVIGAMSPDEIKTLSVRETRSGGDRPGTTNVHYVVKFLGCGRMDILGKPRNIHLFHTSFEQRKFDGTVGVAESLVYVSDETGLPVRKDPARGGFEEIAPRTRR
ncbi:hypothetical protein [Brevundimonas sp. TWP2-3-2]|uniref:hypothetical protein n=1 Tax=unclassified Brevundimonas TaxID=2622653 RepID=UPI003CF3CE4A